MCGGFHFGKGLWSGKDRERIPISWRARLLLCSSSGYQKAAVWSEELKFLVLTLSLSALLNLLALVYPRWTHFHSTKSLSILKWKISGHSSARGRRQPNFFFWSNFTSQDVELREGALFYKLRFLVENLSGDFRWRLSVKFLVEKLSGDFGGRHSGPSSRTVYIVSS